MITRPLSTPASIFRSGLLAIAIAALLGSVSLRAQTIPVTDSSNTSVELRAGIFALSSIDTNMRLTASNGTGGTNINFGDVLGGEKSLNVFRFDGAWQITGPHGLELSWYDIRLRGTKTISTQISWGDQTYPINSTISSQFQTNIYKISYQYTWHRDEKHEFTALLGLHIMRFSTSLSITGVGSSEGLNVTAPLPSFGLGWRAKWSDRFSTRATVQYFGISLESGKYSGHFTDVLIAGEYRIWDNAGIGVGYNRFDLSAELKQTRKLTVDYSYNGLMLYAFTRF